MFAGAVASQFFAENIRAALVEVRAQSRDLVGQNGVVFGECVSNNEPIKHAKPDRVALCRRMSISKSSMRKCSSWRWGARRNTDRTRASNSENANGLTR